jgi:hypothetical protein
VTHALLRRNTQARDKKPDTCNKMLIGAFCLCVQLSFIVDAGHRMLRAQFGPLIDGAAGACA